MPPERKRKRQEATEPITNTADTSKEQYVRSKRVYFDDGNIILVAGDTAFRVHRGQLALHSKVFRGMLAVVAQPPEAEVFDSCPVVKLSDVHYELESLLETLYNIVNISSSSPGFLLETVWNLSTKYIIDIPYKNSFEALSHWFPDTLEKWDALGDERIYFGSVTKVIEIARRTGSDILLPAAFYDLCRYATYDVITFKDPPQDLQMLRTYYHGKEEVATVFPQFIRNESMKGPIAPCEEFMCREGWREFCHEISQWDYRPSNPDPLLQINEYAKRVDEQGGLCYTAKEIAKEWCDQWRAGFWNDLPRIFDLKSWETLIGDSGSDSSDLDA